jgi:nucleotide-binding universal stress UspA family protein
MNNYGDIVVGYDGSKGARHAVEFAAHEAAVHQARLRIVTVWNSASPGMAALTPVAVPDIAADRRRLAQSRLADAAEAARAIAAGLEIELEAIEGVPGPALTEASRNARLLVLGSRGHGGMHALLSGSVGQRCALHALCPVLIVPAGVHEHPPVRDAAERTEPAESADLV